MLETLDLGPLDSRHDKNLPKYFVDSTTYQHLFKKPGGIIVGRKGSGKSALCAKLAAEYEQAGLMAVSFNSSDSYKTTETKNTYSQIATNIKFELISHVSRLIVQKNDLYAQEDIDKLDALNNQTWDKIKGLLKAIKGSISITPFITLTTPELKTARSLLNKSTIDEYFEPLTRALARRKAVILIDDPDAIFSDPEDPDYRFIEALALTTRDLNVQYANLNVIIFLKSSIYDYLNYNFVDMKNIKDQIVKISWDARELSSLIAYRIKHSLQLQENDPNLLWENVFNPTERKIVQEYIFERLVSGPRDLIDFCNDAKEQAKATHQDSIKLEHVLKAESSYSDEVFKDINREYGTKYSGITELIQIIFQGPQFFFKKEELVKKVEKIWRREFDHFGKGRTWFQSATAIELLNIFYLVGLLGYKDASSGRIVFSDDTSDTAALTDALEYHVHKAFQKKLAG